MPNNHSINGLGEGRNRLENQPRANNMATPIIKCMAESYYIY